MGVPLPKHLPPPGAPAIDISLPTGIPPPAIVSSKSIPVGINVNC